MLYTLSASIGALPVVSAFPRTCWYVMKSAKSWRRKLRFSACSFVQKMDVYAILTLILGGFMDSITVAFCSDSKMEVPLHVAASSVLRYLAAGVELKLYVLSSDLRFRDIEKLHDTLARLQRPFQLFPLNPSVEDFLGLRPFHGSLAAYHRLLLPDLIPEQRFLYLDTDIIVTMDVSTLMSVDMHGRALGFDVSTTVKWALEQPFFLSLGMSVTDPYFNSGVMLVDSRKWKEQNCFHRILDFCRAYPNELLAADQTALNALFSNDCFHLPPRYNVSLSTIYRNRDDEDGSIYHFVGSPKPWDLFGKFMHPYYSLWNRHLQQTSLRYVKRTPLLNINNWYRLPHILGGYRRVFRQRGERRRELSSKVAVTDN